MKYSFNLGDVLILKNKYKNSKNINNPNATFVVIDLNPSGMLTLKVENSTEEFTSDPMCYKVKS